MKNYPTSPHHNENGLAILQGKNPNHSRGNITEQKKPTNMPPANNGMNQSYANSFIWHGRNFSSLQSNSNFLPSLKCDHTGLTLIDSQPRQTSAIITESLAADQNEAAKNESFLNKEIRHDPTKHLHSKKIPAINGFHSYSMDSIFIEIDESTGKPTPTLSETFSILHSLSSLLKHGETLSRGMGYCFIIYQLSEGRIYPREGKYGYMYNALSQAPNLDKIRNSLPYMQLHPTLQTLLTTLAAEYWPRCQPNEMMPDGELAATHCDRWVDKFRAQSRKAGFMEEVSEWEEKPIKQYKETVAQFDLMLESAKKPLFIIRIDLSISENSFSTKCLYRLVDALNNLQNNCINKKITVKTRGLVWHFEYQERKGFYYHCVFFCEDTENLTEEELLTTLSEHWKYTILRGKGIVFDCADEVFLQRKAGIGLQDFSKKLAYELFTDEILPMLTLVDLDLRLHIPQESLKGTHMSHTHTETCGYWFDTSK